MNPSPRATAAAVRESSPPMHDHARFLAAFVRRPFDTGAITPSSTHLARVIVDQMGIAEANTVVELGPGTGVFTKVIQDQLKPGARFPGVQVVNDSVENLAHHLKAAGRHEVDTTISGLPWAAFSPGRQRILLDAAVDALRPGGRFATFGYSHAAWLPTGRKFRELLRSRFQHVETSKVVWRNMPPAFVYRCRK